MRSSTPSFIPERPTAGVPAAGAGRCAGRRSPPEASSSSPGYESARIRPRMDSLASTGEYRMRRIAGAGGATLVLMLLQACGASPLSTATPAPTATAIPTATVAPTTTPAGPQWHGLPIYPNAAFYADHGSDIVYVTNDSFQFSDGHELAQLYMEGSRDAVSLTNWRLQLPRLQ